MAFNPCVYIMMKDLKQKDEKPRQRQQSINNYCVCTEKAGRNSKTL